ncbi:MAG: carboxypeptidase-like regulatory domain-containing protein [candidate division WOR-3 bacterium]
MILFKILIAFSSISGRVIDKKTSESLPFVFVYIKDLNKGTLTDERGFYVISKLKEGKYLLCFKIVGYEEKCLEVELREGENKILNVELNQIEIEIEKIIIYSRKKEFEEERASAVKRETEILKRLPKFIEGDLLRTVSTLPGVVQVTDLSGRFSVRGGSPQENLTLIDEIPLYNPYHLGGIFSVFDLSALSRYEFYRGAYGAQFGNALSSLLYAEIKPYNSEKINLELALSFLSFRLLNEGKLFKGNYLVFLRRTYFDKYISLINRDFEFPYHFFDILSSYQIEKSPSLRFKFSYITSRDLFYQKKDEILLKWGNDGFSFRTFYIHRKNFHEINLFFSSFFSYFKIGEFISLWNPVSIAGLKWKGEFKGSFDKTFGFEYENLNGKFQNDIFGIKQLDKGNPHILSFFSELNFKVNNLRINPGLRTNYFYLRIKETPERNAKSFRMEPRINLKYFLRENLAIKFAFGVFNQYLMAINFSEVFDPFYYWVTIFDGYRPMNSKHYITGISYLPDWGKIDFEIFYKKYDYILDYEIKSYDPLNPDKTLFLKGQGESYGFDSFIEKTFGKLNFNLSFTVLKSHGKFEKENKYHSLRWDKTFNFSLSLFYKLIFNLDLGLNFLYTTGSPFTDVIKRYRFFYNPYPDRYPKVIWDEIESYPYSVRFPPYHRLDISLSRDFKIKKIKGFYSLSIINVYNRKNVFLYYYDYDKEPPIKRELYQIPFVPSFEIKIIF